MKNLLIIVIFLSLLDSIKALDSITIADSKTIKNATKTNKNIKNIESKSKSNDTLSDDLLMLNAADLSLKGEYESAIEIYENLYKKTKEPHFLKQIAIAYAQSNNLESALNYAKKYQDLSKEKDDVETNLIVAESLIRKGEFEAASKILERVNKAGATLQTRYILANLYLQLNKFDLALIELIAIYDDDNIYATPLKMEVLNQIITIYFVQNREADAFKYINDFVANEPSLEIEKFIPLYVKYNRLSDLKTALRTRFEASPNIENLRILVATLLELKESNLAVQILKTSDLGEDSTILLMHVFANMNDFKEAKILADKLYKDTQDVEYLGLSAVYNFELMQDKSKENLSHTIDTLKYVITQKTQKLKAENKNLSEAEAFYYNFLGYLLIDYDIDAKAGLDYVSKALAVSPHSIEYLDSLAWGFYKIKDCQKAKETIELIPQQQIERTEEILKHYEKINTCKG
ncbi:ATP-dependent nuclease [Helicobacter saguini]|uniref:ATP-dependent nuclease n=1 Tax=Helicobacter saguini TaxID=1548018 RepID=A0A347VN23_9HELI|nr:CDC27 family protein [Helicobacter saguini]MWV61932.1 ATP-dependent nuclease [Helicobacter saguini]MWV67393.1 ATP-dependent nuclease [Helicobacter saguini]MWV69746.1 ATP-dependent nuclease [Helicobacter saguini]MWV73037.1 ATP-dependent nuclease [Helicobacter saguini]TLD95587.1 ATP-dependent nuclease [Helicobacter saguini]